VRYSGRLRADSAEESSREWKGLALIVDGHLARSRVWRFSL